MKDINQIAAYLHGEYQAAKKLIAELDKECHNLAGDACALTFSDGGGMQIGERYCRPQIYFDIASGLWRANLQWLSRGRWMHHRTLIGEWGTHQAAEKAAIENMKQRRDVDELRTK